MGKGMGAVAMEAEQCLRLIIRERSLPLHDKPDSLFPLHHTLRMNDPSWDERTLLLEAAEMKKNDAEEQRNKDTKEQRKREEESNSKIKSDAKMATEAPAGKKT